MRSLQLALSHKGVPWVLSVEIEAYLDLSALRNWRATNKLAFQETEEKVKKLFQSVDCLNFVHEPTGPFLGSAWFQFMTQVYQCENCGQYESSDVVAHYDKTEAEEAKLCGGCFVDLVDVSVCESCNINTRGNNGCYCTECDEFFCNSCTEFVSSCRICGDIFCVSCMLLERCLNCW